MLIIEKRFEIQDFTPQLAPTLNTFTLDGAKETFKDIRIPNQIQTDLILNDLQDVWLTCFLDIDRAIFDIPLWVYA